jgi:hypothetical protein
MDQGATRTLVKVPRLSVGEDCDVASARASVIKLGWQCPRLSEAHACPSTFPVLPHDSKADGSARWGLAASLAEARLAEGSWQVLS